MPVRKSLLEPGACVAVVGAAGYGKTTLLEDAPSSGTSCYDAADLVEDDLPAGQAPDLVIVDNLSRLDADTRHIVAEKLGSLPHDTTIAVAVEAPLDAATARLLGRRVVTIGPAELALSIADVDELMHAEYGVADADLAAYIADITAGWPQLSANIAEIASTVERDGLLAAAVASESPTARWVDTAVLGRLDSDQLAVLTAVADLSPLATGLVDEVGRAIGLPDATKAFDRLTSEGLVVAVGEGRSRVVPVIAARLAAHQTPDDDATRLPALTAAAGWYAAHQLARAALRCLNGVGDLDACAALLEADGDRVLMQGGAAEVVRVIAALPPKRVNDALVMLHANAARMSGDIVAAQRGFGRLLSATDPVDPGLAWRIAAMHYVRADYAAAVEICTRPSTPAETVAQRADCARRGAWHACALAMLGDADIARSTAAEALAAAEASNNDSAVALAHLASSLTTTGARHANHLAAALTAAERAGDDMLVARALGNQAHGLTCDANYSAAVGSAERAVSLGEGGGPPGALLSALQNLGDALTGLGRFDDARRAYERSLGVARRAGIARTPSALLGLAEIDYQRGHVERSRTAYTEIVDLARDSDEHQALIPALSRLATVTARAARDDDDLALATALADEAVDRAQYLYVATALLARGWVAAHAGDNEGACALGRGAAESARDVGDQGVLAEALELIGATASDPAVAAGALEEALQIWSVGGAVVWADRVRVSIGQLPTASRSQRCEGKVAATRLSDRGITSQHGMTGAQPRVSISVLGPFKVRVDGVPVPVPAWKSRQARSLLKILAARRGRPIARSELCEVLWPDDDPQRTGHRLSVLLSAVRNVLDPGKQCPADHYLSADLSGIRLDTSQVNLDVDGFVDDASRAADLAHTGDVVAARALFDEVEAAYRGDAFEDDPYEDWAEAVREDLRAVWLRSLRLSAKLSAQAGDIDNSVTCLVRILGVDPYDEPTHRTLVDVLSAAGRHGEARRAFDRWTRAMDSLGATAPTAPSLGHDTSRPPRPTRHSTRPATLTSR